MMELHWRGRTARGDAALDTDLRALLALPGAAGGRLYAATGRNGGVTGYAVAADGGLRPLDGRAFPPGPLDGPGGVLALRQEAGGPRLHAGGGSAPWSLALEADGGFGPAATTPRPGAGGPVTALAVLGEGAEGLLVAADAAGLSLLGPGAARFQPAGTGASGAGAADLATARIGAAGFLLAPDPAAAALAAFRLEADGTLQPTARFGAAQGLGLALPSQVETVSALGEQWVLLAGAGSSSLSVLRLDGAGGLEAADHVIDSRATRFAGVQALEVARVGDRVFVLAGGSDDGLSLFTLLPDGRLLHLQSLADSAGRGLADITAIESLVLPGALQVYVASEGAAGLARLDLDLSALGRVTVLPAGSGRLAPGSAGDDLLAAGGSGDTLSGGAGDDILVAAPGISEMRGGAGADLFVLDAAGDQVLIPDFDPAVDRLDLSDLPMLRDPGQVGLRWLGDGALLVYRDQVVTLRGPGGGGWTEDDILGALQPGPDRMLVLARPDGLRLQAGPGGEALAGGDLNDTLLGGAGPDRLAGAAGHDLLMGHGGDDRLSGDAGDDRLWAGEGDDTLEGGDGDDRMGGGGGDDVLAGGAGADTLAGHPGNDTLEGGTGGDRIWAGRGNDSVDAGPGDDTVAAGSGNDRIAAGDGADLVFGTGGPARIRGGAGNDTLWGATGSDTLMGGADDDWIDGGAAEDLVEGGGGDDLLRGGAGADTLRGGMGDDTLDGSWGAGDLLEGGPGADVFVFAPHRGSERIVDFTPGEGDRLQLDPALWQGGEDLQAMLRDHGRTGPGGSVILEFGHGDTLEIAGPGSTLAEIAAALLLG